MTPLLVLKMEATNHFNEKGFQKSIIVDEKLSLKCSLSTKKKHPTIATSCCYFCTKRVYSVSRKPGSFFVITNLGCGSV